MIEPHLGSEPNQSPLKRLSVISLRVRKASIPSPSKVFPSNPGTLKIQSPGLFKGCYNYKLTENSLTVTEKQSIDKTVSEQLESTCRICLSNEKIQSLIAPCSCSGSLKYVHEECLKKWILSKNEENLSICELCKEQLKMEFEVVSICLPFNGVKTCKAWIPFIISLFLLFGLIAICYICVQTRSSNVYLLFGALFIGFLFAGCCVRSIFSTLVVCFERKIESWKIADSQELSFQL